MQFLKDPSLPFQLIPTGLLVPFFLLVSFLSYDSICFDSTITFQWPFLILDWRWNSQSQWLCPAWIDSRWSGECFEEQEITHFRHQTLVVLFLRCFDNVFIREEFFPGVASYWFHEKCFAWSRHRIMIKHSCSYYKRYMYEQGTWIMKNAEFSRTSTSFWYDEKILNDQ